MSKNEQKQFVNAASVFPKIKGMSKTEFLFVGLIIAVVWIGLALSLALTIHFPLLWFGASWSNYWGWVVLLGAVPALRVWFFGR